MVSFVIHRRTFANSLDPRVHTGKFGLNSRTFQEFLKDFITVFKDLKLKKNTDLHVKILESITKDISFR